MGEVYEAEDIESGRRVALKRLRQSLGSDIDRARFMREGRLAASINHEHVVYVYGSEEIDDSPVIVMELGAGGSLKDRIEAHGTMPAVAAVDAILQVIEGLEATASSGVLHRDVKPSNCFISNDGTIKVGDFGLSISTETRVESHLTVEGAVLGTPAFASPEQVTGHALDVRSDIYSTGATLYFLLTGRPPFVRDSVVQVIGSVIKESPPSPASLVAGVSPDLAWIVLRCLEKDPRQRFQSYDDLRQALLPHSSRRFTPARLHSRFLAGVVDEVLCSLPLTLTIPSPTSSYLFSRQGAAHLLGTSIVALIYFGLLEGTWGASVGKWLLGMRVVSGQQPVTLPQALLRVTLWLAVTALLPFGLGMVYENAVGNRLGDGLVLMLTIGLALLFVTARRTNGFAGIHDLLTSTRVVERPASPVRSTLQLPPRPEPRDPRAQRVGAYLVVENLDATDTGKLVLAYDDVLRRHVWIHMQPPGAPEVSPERRALARPGRLHWLSGRRTRLEAWDAYDAPAGVPLMSLVREPQSWSLVRFLLYDMAVEAQAILNTHENAPIALERIWVTQGGGAVLLDFVAPGTVISAAVTGDAPSLMTRAAFLALSGSVRGKTLAAVAAVASLPLHACEFLERLERGTTNLPTMIAALHKLLAKPVTLTWRRRLTHLAIVGSIPIALSVWTLIALIAEDTFTWSALTTPIAAALFLVLTPSIYTAAFFRGGWWFPLLGIAVTTRTGRRASRMLSFWRAVIAWLPSLAFTGGVMLGIPWVAAAAAVLIAVGIVSAVLTPDRGLHDRLLGTRLVRQ